MTESQRKNLSKGKQFTKDYQPEKSGRKPNIYTKLKQSNLSKQDIINIFKLVLDQSPKQLKKGFDKIKKMESLEKTNDKPMLYYIIISAMFKDLKTGSLNNVMSVLTRWLGYPKQDIGLDSNNLNMNIDYSDLSEKDKEEVAKALFKKKMEEIRNG